MAAFCACLDFASVLLKIDGEDCSNNNDNKIRQQRLRAGEGVPLLLIYFALFLQDKFKREVKGGRCSTGTFPKQKDLLDRKESVKAV